MFKIKSTFVFTYTMHLFKVHDCYILFYLQIRDRFKRRMTTIFPAVRDEKNANKTSQANLRGVGAPKKIEVLPYSNSEFELKQW